MKYKMIISDYDGTLGVAPNNDIDKQTLDAINKFIAKGGIFSVCSGREYRSIRKICTEQGLKGLVVSFQGARIHDIETGERLYSNGLKRDIAKEVLQAVKEYKLSPIIYTEERFYITEHNEYVERYERAVKMQGVVVDPYTLIDEKGEVCKLGWVGPDDIVVRAANELNQKFKDQGVVFNSGAECLLEAVNPNCTKGNAVRFLANHYNVPLDQVMTIGDSTNDIDLTVGEWHGVAVGDGKEELKAVAKEVTVPFSQKPVKTLIEKYCLND